MQATDELAAELLYLTGAAAKGESVKGDDLPGLHAAAVDKVKVRPRRCQRFAVPSCIQHSFKFEQTSFRGAPACARARC